MPRLRPHSAAFTLLLGALVTLASFATDMGLPVLAATAASLGVSAGDAALTLSVFLAGFALGPLLFGPLSDHYGRRPVLLAGCAAFSLFGALGAFSESLRALLLWRFLMGMGAGTSQVLVVAMVTGTMAFCALLSAAVYAGVVRRAERRAGARQAAGRTEESAAAA